MSTTGAPPAITAARNTERTSDQWKPMNASRFGPNPTLACIKTSGFGGFRTSSSQNANPNANLANL
jgi:hypothetical protein